MMNAASSTLQLLLAASPLSHALRKLCTHTHTPCTTTGSRRGVGASLALPGIRSGGLVVSYSRSSPPALLVIIIARLHACFLLLSLS
jgi:hypothetical protein